jgi:hypothetical protein
VAPLGTTRHHYRSDFVDPRGNGWSPPEVICRVCGEAEPLATDELVDVDTVLHCHGRHRLLPHLPDGHGRWPCRRTFLAPAAATFVMCPRCGTTRPGPAG